MSLFALLRDLLVYASDPLTPHHAELSNREEWTFFQGVQKGGEEGRESFLPVKSSPIGIGSPARSNQAVQPPIFKSQVQDHRPGPFVEQAPERLPSPPPFVRSSSLKVSDDTQKWSEVKRIVTRIAPTLILHEEPLENTQLSGKVDVVILLCCSSEKTREFVYRLAKAIEKHLGKVKVTQIASIAEEERWEPFFSQVSPRLVITTEKVGDLFTQLPCLVLSPVATYEVPAQKAILWRALCHYLKQ